MLSEHELHRMKVSAYEFLHEKEITSSLLSIEEIRSKILNGLLYKLSTEILTENFATKTITVEKAVIFKTPKTWWDQLKAEHANSFWMRILAHIPFYRKNKPLWELTEHVEYVTLLVEVQPSVLFPSPMIAYPKELGRTVRYVKYKY